MSSREAISYHTCYIILGMRSVRGVSLVSCRQKKEEKYDNGIRYRNLFGIFYRDKKKMFS